MPSIKIPTSPPPLSPYGIFNGDLFQYSRNLVAFESTPRTTDILPKCKCILVGGLSDGLIPTPYTKQLEEACHAESWSFIQPILSSSYLGFGNGDLDRDSNEITELMWYLTCHRSAETFCLVGHSTGCQNSVHWLKHGPSELTERTMVVILQAPVSDREQPMTEPGYADNIQNARELVENGKGDEMMPRSVFWAPITAQRFLDLQEVGGRDDFFSSDFSDAQLRERLGHVGGLSSPASKSRKVLVVCSGADEYVPEHVDTKSLTERLVDAMNGDERSEDKDKKVAESLYLETANHNLSEGPGDAQTFVAKVTELLREATE